MGMRVALQSIWTWGAILVLMVLWVPLLALLRVFDRDPAHYRTGRWFRRLGMAMTKVNPAWHIEISGETIENPRYPYVVVSNHQSSADIPIISCLPWEMKWVAKAELFKAPLFGWLLRLAGDIPVDRTNKRSGAKVLIKGRQYLRDRCSVMFFPEGTRSRDGRVHPFTDGAFRLAIKAQVPVLPLAIDGTQDALPTHSWKFRAATIHNQQSPMLDFQQPRQLRSGRHQSLGGRAQFYPSRQRRTCFGRSAEKLQGHASGRTTGTTTGFGDGVSGRCVPRRAGVSRRPGQSGRCRMAI